MAIGFARVEFVKRSAGKNACAKAAYNSRSEVEFEGSDHADPKTYDWSEKTQTTHHDVLLPCYVDAKFKDQEVLWNAVEKKEVKSNAQVAMEVVLALPDDKVVTVEDKIQLTRSFVQEHFVNKGLAAQIDIHAPEPLLIITRDNQELGLKKGMRGHITSQSNDKILIELDSGAQISLNPKEFTGFIVKEHNWHAHVLLTTRRFKENGLEFEDGKARDMVPRINKGRVVAGPDWGKLWAEHQNHFFQEKGLDLRVDTNGIVPQEHLGPYRMRGRAFSMFEEHHDRLEANQVESKDPEKILEAITAQKSIFTKEDVGCFLSKHISADTVDEVLKGFWQQPKLVQLADIRTGALVSKFTSKKVIEEEQQILRLSDRIHEKESFNISSKVINLSSKGLNKEQQQAFQGIVKGQRLSLIQGYAGTGKSHLLKALQTAYEETGYRVRALGPDNTTAEVLREKGLPHTENVFRFLFGLHNDRRKILNGKEVWILDEAGKLGNRPLLEFLREAEKRDVQVILSGDAAQMPPVERGGMFKAFCEQYGSQVLEDIQRQKEVRHRDIARNLATGDFGSALDQLSSVHGVRWSGNKREAMEELILRWAKDTRAFPQASALIIAHSNAEVKVLNEMVRLIRKQRGELAEKEFQCSTSQGNIYVSVGDRLEFRSNNKDLGLTNGLSGTLIEAEPDRFVVAVHSEAKKRQTVVFNPQEYHAFQLGYASTFYRSQGRTIDRAYVLHSPMMNKEMFYVGLTRHVKDVNYFVSKEEVYCLADLKRMALKSSSKSLTVDYTTLQEINAQKESQERIKQIQSLKESESILSKVKGYGLETWDLVVNKAGDVKDRIQDRFPNQAFYNPSIPDLKEKSFPVIEIVNAALAQDLKQEKEPGFAPMETSSLSSRQEQANDFTPSLLLFDKFNPEQKTYAKDYFINVHKAATLKDIVDAETEGTARDIRFATHFRAWQEACGDRNKSAYEFLQRIPAKELGGVLEPKAIAILEEQAGRYEFFLAKKEGAKQQLDEQLKTHIEPLLYRLYPEGPASRDRTSFRFGSKGSLSVAHSGTKAGQFYDFEQKEGGGLMKLIQRELGLGKVEARAWAQDFLGVASDISIPKTFKRPSQELKSEDAWVSLRPDPSVPAPKLEELKGKKLGFYFNEVTRHAYKDENGQLLYYVLRLQDKNDSSRKITPPLSYGYWKSKPEKIGWELKGYQDDKRSLYNLHLLKDNPNFTVLIVEGEKTADQALQKLTGETYICMTWPGGAGSVQKADWTPLQGRKVLIWPDNDKVGYKAASDICTELRKLGVQSMKVVDSESLKQHFPEKWDLADPMPMGVSDNVPERLLATALEKSIDTDKVMHRLSLDPNDPVLKARLTEILWRVDERMRPGLEDKHGIQYWKVHEEIVKEAARIFSDQDKRVEEIKEKFGIGGVALERLNYQMAICEAEHGRKPRTSEINTLKLVIKEHGYVQTPKIEEKGVSEIAVDKMLRDMCSRALQGVSVDKIASSKSEKALTQKINEVQQQIRQDLVIQSDQRKALGKETGNSLRI